MEFIVKNRKLKCLTTILLLLSIVLTTFTSSFASVKVKADSNDRRMALLNLGKGKSLTDINADTALDSGSLRTLAVYLSNFYIPFITVLDAKVDKKDLKDAGNKSHTPAMKKALMEELGLDKNSAEVLVNYLMQQSLDTCSQLYVTEPDLYQVWKYFDISNAIERDGSVSSSAVTGEVNTSDDGSNLLGNGMGTTGSLTEHTSVSYASCINDKDDNKINSKAYRDYKKAAGEIVVKGVHYVGVTYPIFLQIMGVGTKIGTSSNDVYGTGHYNIKNRGFNNFANESNDALVSTSKVRRINFYCKDNSADKVNIVFSNSDECIQAYLDVCNNLDYEHGWGSSMSWLAPEDIDAISMKGGTTIEGTAFGAKLYVNWEGSLILDTSVYRTPIFPGCANPHLLTTIKDKGDNANTIPLQNIFAIQRILDGNLVNHSVDVKTSLKDSTTIKSPAFKYKTGKSLLDLYYWRIAPADSSYDFDKSKDAFKSTWGSYEALFNVFKKTSYIYVETQSGADKVTFPSFSKIKQVSKGSGYVALNSTYGIPKLNSKLAYYDSLSDDFNSTSSLSDIFKTMELTNYADSKELDKLKKSLECDNLNVATHFSNIKELGHTATYNKSCQKFFRSLFYNYCFAYFNKDKTKPDEDSVVDLKMNVKNFPSFVSNIDWSTLYSSDKISEQVMSWLYYLLHPTEGIAYVATWLKNKIGGFLISWHDDIVGSTDSNSATGMTKYLGTSSYTATSGLYDVPWISSILSSYNSIIVYIIVLMFLILLCYVLCGSLNLQRGILGVVMFAILAFVPPVAISATVNVCNKTSDVIYSKKFSYWAISQMETWLQNFDKAKGAKSQSDFTTYTAFVLNDQAQLSSGIGGTSKTTYSGAKVKWMTPKRYSSLATVSSKLDSVSTDANYLKSLMLSSISKSTSGETFLDSDNALYLYRDFTDIYRYSSVSYNVIGTFNFNGSLLDTSKITKSSYYNVVPYNSKDINTISNAWNSSSMNTNKITKDMKVTKYITANSKYNSTDEDIYSETSSLRAMERGFLVDTASISSKAGSLKKKNYYYNIGSDDDKGGNSTLATTYLALYNSNVVRVHQKYKNFADLCEEKITLKLGDDILNKGSEQLNDEYNSSLSSSMFNYGGLLHSTSDFSDLKLGFNELITSKDDFVLDMETNAGQDNGASYRKNLFRQLSSLYYSLYSESPYYFFSNNIRDQVDALTAYTYNYDSLANAKEGGSFTDNGIDGDDGSEKGSAVARMFLTKNQSYFFNLADDAGQGYGELRDFMNMHDFFYYIMPMLKEGTDLARLYDKTFGLYYDDDCSLKFNVEGTDVVDMSFTYNGKKYKSLDKFSKVWNGLNNEERYKFWHTYNTFSILLNYTAWLDTMMDCNYTKSETIRVMGDKFTVQNPLDPTSYYKTDKSGNIIAGRLMVFSKSEMNYYGLKESDLTEVERKVIKLQDNVYNETLDLMNYYSLSDETLIHAYAMLQTFEFNKIFSQESIAGNGGYTLYPQGYELKAFSYDAYLRMILSEASSESLMSGGNTKKDGTTETNTSIYKRIQANTSLFFAIFLLINDVLAVYIIPGLKLFFIVCIFFTSIALIISASIKMEFNIMRITWKSLFAPLLSFGAISIGMSYLVSMFMGTGANGVVQSGLIINLGDPTATLIVMIVINAGVTILYFKICKKCFHDLRTYFKAVFDNIGAAVVGAAGTVAKMAQGTGGIARRIGIGGKEVLSKVASTAKQRGKDNAPTSGKAGIGSGIDSGIGSVISSDLLSDTEKAAIEKENNRKDAIHGMNKYDKKAFEGANARVDKEQAKLDKINNKLQYKDENGNMVDNEMLSKGKAKRLKASKAWHEKRLAKKQQRADDIRKYGKFGAMRKRVGSAYKSAKQFTSRASGVAKSGVSRAQSLANAASSNAKKTGKFIKNGGVGRVIGSGTGHIVNGASATATFVRQTPQRVKKGAIVAGTAVSTGARQAVGYTVRAAQGAPVVVKKAGLSTLRAGRNATRATVNAGRDAARATFNAGRYVATETAHIVGTNISEGRRSYDATRKNK